MATCSCATGSRPDHLGGANLYPAEIEAEIITHPKVADVAVFGIPDEEWGEQVKAVVQPAAGVPPSDELAAEILASLEAGCQDEVAKTIDFTDELPRDPSGKLLKRRLRILLGRAGRRDLTTRADQARRGRHRRS